MDITEVDFWVDDIGFPENGFYIIQAYAGDGKTSFLTKLLAKYVKKISSDDRVVFMYSEYNIQTNDVHNIPDIDYDQIIWNYMPVGHSTIKDVKSLIERIDSLEHDCNKRKQKLTAVMFDDFDSWIATHSRFAHGTSLHSVIQDSCTELGEYANKKDFPIFATMMIQRDPRVTKLGTTLHYVKR